MVAIALWSVGISFFTILHIVGRHVIGVVLISKCVESSIALLYSLLPYGQLNLCRDIRSFSCLSDFAICLAMMFGRVLVSPHTSILQFHMYCAPPSMCGGI